jgi:hypothetical protein
VLLHEFVPGQAQVFQVEPGLNLARHGVVDAALVMEPDHGSTLAGDHCLPQSGVVVMVTLRRPATGIVALRLQDLEVPVGLPRQLVDHVRVGS